MKKKAYLCNTLKHCRDSRWCTQHCKHTFDEMYAKNKHHIANDSEEIFEKVKTEDGILFIERE